MGAVVGRRNPAGPTLLCPAGACRGADAEWSELVERENAIG